MLAIRKMRKTSQIGTFCVKNAKNGTILKDPADQVKTPSPRENWTMTIRVELVYYFQSALRSKKVKNGEKQAQDLIKGHQKNFKNQKNDHNQTKRRNWQVKTSTLLKWQQTT